MDGASPEELKAAHDELKNAGLVEESNVCMANVQGTNIRPVKLTSVGWGGRPTTQPNNTGTDHCNLVIHIIILTFFYGKTRSCRLY